MESFEQDTKAPGERIRRDHQAGGTGSPVVPRRLRDAPIAKQAAYGGLVLGTALVYLLAAKLGLSLADVAEQVSAVWPPSGIALAALFLLGHRFWPGVWLGAFLANVTTHEPAVVAAGVATGNTLEALAAVFLLRRVARFDPAFERLRDVVGFVALAAASTVIAASIGVASLCLGGVQSWSRAGAIWSTWWVGDAIGDLVLAPAILAFSSLRWSRWRALEAGEGLALMIGVAATGLAVFGGGSPPVNHLYPYSVFPFVIWAALRLGQPATALTILLITALADWGTTQGLGGFAALPQGGRLVALQLFIGIVALTGLLLSAAISERNTAERRRAADLAVTQILSVCPSLKTAVPRIVQAICETLDWDLGSVWTVDRKSALLRCEEIWHRPGVRFPRFVELTRTLVFEPGIGLPGRVWASGHPDWIEDVTQDRNFPRAPVAALEGLHGAFAFPIILDGEVRGVIEFFSRRIRRPDRSVLQMFDNVGAQMGQFMGRKQYEKIALENEARARDIIDSVLDCIVTIDGKGLITDFNPAAEATFGFERTEVLGQDLAAILCPEPMREAYQKDLMRYLETGGETMLGRRIETEARRKDGTELMVELAITAIRHGDPPFATAYMRDITDRKRAESERAELLAREREAREGAESANRLKDEFLATLSHELRTPLNAILGWTYLLREGGLDEEETHRALETIRRNVTAQSQIISDILDVSRLISGKLDLNVEPLDLAVAIAGVLDTVRPAADAKRVRLIFAREETAAPPFVSGDPRRIGQIIWNLLSNAIRFVPDRGSVEIGLAVEGGRAEITVADDGPGIDPAFLPHVFERFRQADSSSTRPHRGLGLGLAIVRHLVEAHGGSIEASNRTDGTGAVFRFRLPLLPAALRPLETPRSSHVAGADGSSAPSVSIRDGGDEGPSATSGASIPDAGAEGPSALVGTGSWPRSGAGSPLPTPRTPTGSRPPSATETGRGSPGARTPASAIDEELGTGARVPEAALRPPRQDLRPAPARLDSRVVAPDLPRTTLRGLRILVVDDDRDAREMMTTVLGRCGADVVTAGSADEALARIEEAPPHLLLADIEMPGEDGYSLLRRVRELPIPGGGTIPAAALTAYASPSDRSRALAAGFEVHVTKPIQPEELEDIVAKLVGRGPEPR